MTPSRPLSEVARVVTPVTLSEASVVAPAVRVPKVAPPVALNWPVMVEEPVTARLVVVPLWREKVPPVMRPVFEMVKSVVVAKAAVEEEMAKRVVGTTVLPVVEAAKIERSAYGEEVPIPKVPSWELKVSVVVPVAPKRTVEEALKPPKRESVVEVALVLTPKLLVGVNG